MDRDHLIAALQAAPAPEGCLITRLFVMDVAGGSRISVSGRVDGTSFVGYLQALTDAAAALDVLVQWWQPIAAYATSDPVHDADADLLFPDQTHTATSAAPTSVTRTEVPLPIEAPVLSDEEQIDQAQETPPQAPAPTGQGEA